MGVRVDGFMDTPVGVRVLKIDGAFAPRVLKIDTALGREGCGGRLRCQFVENHTTGLRPWENRPTAPLASVGRFIGKSFYVQAKDQLRPTWRPSAGSPHGKCTPIPAYGGTSPGGGSFSGVMPCDAYETYQISAISPFGGFATTFPPASLVGLWVLSIVPHDTRGKRRAV